MHVTPRAQDHRRPLLNKPESVHPVPIPRKALVIVSKQIHPSQNTEPGTGSKSSAVLDKNIEARHGIHSINGWHSHQTHEITAVRKIHAQCTIKLRFPEQAAFFTSLGNRKARSWVAGLPQSPHSLPSLPGGFLPGPGPAPNHSGLTPLELSPQGLFQHPSK